VNAYRALFLGHALACLICIAVLGRLPKFEPLPGAHQESLFTALRDKPFVAYAALSGAMFLQYMVLALLLLPVWVVYHTHAPRWSVSAFVIVNTVIVVLFQVRVGKNVQSIRQGGAALRRAGVIFLFSCSVMGLATGVPSWAALLLLAGPSCCIPMASCGMPPARSPSTSRWHPGTRRGSTRAWSASATGTRCGGASRCVGRASDHRRLTRRTTIPTFGNWV